MSLTLELPVAHKPQFHPDLSLEMRGPVGEFFMCNDPEVMVAGPAGTAKSVFISMRVYLDACRYPGSRQLIARESLKRVKQSWETATWRARILAPGNPLLKAWHRKTENKYVIPFPNGDESVIEMGGLDDAQRYYSSEFDRVWINEAHDRHVTLDMYERFARSLRSFKMPYQQIIADMNPGAKTHWTYRRFTESYEGGPPRATAFEFRHRHNPGYWDEENQCWTAPGEHFLKNLPMTTSGVRYKRLFLGEWCGAEGAVYDMWDPELHVLHGETVKEDGEWILVVDDQEGCPGRLVDGKRRIKLEWFAAGQDFGMRNPGSMTVFGFDKEGRAYLVDEIYRTGKNVNWWAEQAVQMHRKYDLVRLVCDSADGSSISVFNDYLGPRQGRDAGRIAIQCDKGAGEGGRSGVLTGINILHVRMQRADDGLPRFFVLDGSIRHPRDEMLEGKPSGFAEEVPDYVWKPVDDTLAQNKNAPEEPMKLQDHACFPAGTSILTPDGGLPIESIAIGDVVVTPMGWRHVTGSACTGRKRLLCVRLSDGRELEGTADHPVWTQRGFVRLDSLTPSDTLCVWHTSTLTVGGTGETRLDTTSEGNSRSQGPLYGPSFTAGCGSSTTGRSPRVTSFTTLMGTKRTTAPRTSNASPQASMGLSIWRTSTRPSLRHGPGTVHRRGLSGIVRMRSTASLDTPGGRTCASNAELSSRGQTETVFGSVGTTASRPSVETLKSMTRSEDARYVMKATRATSTRSSELALVRVERVFDTKRSEPVYALSVDVDGVYFADGVLVSNCDGIRYVMRWAHQRNYTTPASETGWKGTWRDYITHYKMDPA